MKTVLFTSLRSQTDLLRSAHIINSFHENNPNVEIHLLTLKELHESAELLSNVKKIHTINSQKVSQFLDSEIYSNALAINEFTDSLNEVIKTQWSEVYNLSNDSLSAYILSSLNTQSITGTHIGNYGSSTTTSNWATYLNSVCAKESTRTISLMDVKAHMLKTPLSDDSIGIKIDQDFALKAGSNFSKIRSSKASSQVYIVGISLRDGVNGEYIDTNTLISILDNLESSENYKAVLITNNRANEKEIVNELNKHFDNKLITVNTDIVAQPAVLSNLDCLVSCSNETLALAEMLDTFSIEICMDAGKPQVERAGHFIIEAHGDFTNDVSFILNQKFETIMPVSSMNSDNKTYQTIKDEYGFSKTQTRGPIDINKEISYHLKRTFNYALQGYPVNQELLRNLQENISREEMSQFIELAKDEITFYVKTLLTALRSLKTTKENAQNTDTFIHCLDKLIQAANDSTLASGALGLLEGRIENISSTDKDENINEIEKYLFELKSDLQVLTNIFGELMNNGQKRAIKSEAR